MAETKTTETKITFESLNLSKPLLSALSDLGWKDPSPIQAESLPYALDREDPKDIIGIAETGSGKTGAFAIPIIEALLQKPQRMYALVLAPTRELAFQISEQFEALGSKIDLKTVTIVGGVDMTAQAVSLARRPHVIVATPGRLVDHLEHTKGFSLQTFKFLVLDEADRMLGLDFEKEIDVILQSMPRERRTYLFSATMTNKVKKLQRAALANPVKVQVNSKYTTVKTLIQNYIFIPEKYKDCYLSYILNEFSGQTGLVFVRTFSCDTFKFFDSNKLRIVNEHIGTCAECQRVALLLRNLGFKAVCLHGKMTQPKRLAALQKFKSGSRNVLIATDVASRGLDIPSVDIVLNFSIPSNAKDYVHRVGRTARAGRSGRAISFVTQYDVEAYQKIEAHIEKKLQMYQLDKESVMVMLERVDEAQRMAAQEMRDQERKKKGGKKRKGGGRGSRDDGDRLSGLMKRKKMSSMRKGGRGGGNGRRR
jgi:ATP-dependent RNA helicase DDX47/RRP3